MILVSNREQEGVHYQRSPFQDEERKNKYMYKSTISCDEYMITEGKN